MIKVSIMLWINIRISISKEIPRKWKKCIEKWKSFTGSRIPVMGWAVVPTRRYRRTDIPTRAFISMTSIFTTTIALGTLLGHKRWIFFFLPLRRHWAKTLCLGRAPLSPVRRLRSLREWILTTRRISPLLGSHSILIIWRWTDFRSQNSRARWGVEIQWRIIRHSPTEYIKIKKNDGIIITFVHPNTNINRQTFRQQIFCQPIKSLSITICNEWSNRADFGSEYFQWITSLN